MRTESKKITKQEALDYHSKGISGKLEIKTSKNISTPDLLSLAYSPGVGYPCLEIQKNSENAYKYTSKSHLVAVISNGTAVLGLGNLGALASKPVMEGKAVLFKNFANIDCVDIEVDETDVDKFVECVKKIAPTFGGINLEDIKAPECFLIEEKLKKEVDIPIFHDDQHGTAICSLAGIINALDITNKKIDEVTMVVNGAGAAAIACTKLAISYGLKKENVIMCDSKGVIHDEREDLNQWKKEFAIKTDKRTLTDAMDKVDIFLGLSKGNIINEKMLLSMNKDAIIFAMANPEPEIKPELAKAIRNDIIIATGRSDYPNQVNNLLAFPYIFKGALAVRATIINEEMKVATAIAIADLAKQIIPDKVTTLYQSFYQYGKDYIIPTPFDPRLLSTIPVAVAKAAIESGVAKNKDFDLEKYEKELMQQMDPTTISFKTIHKVIRENKRKILFVDGEREEIILSAFNFKHSNYGHPILLGNQKKIKNNIKNLNLNPDKVEIINTMEEAYCEELSKYLYKKVWRKGLTQKACLKLVKNSDNIFGALLLDKGDVDSLITGRSMSFDNSFKEISMVISKQENTVPMEIRVLHINNRQLLFIADTHVHEYPTAQELATIACQSAERIKYHGFTPRVALISHNNFGKMDLAETQNAAKAKAIMDTQNLDFEYEGDMNISYALDHKKLIKDFPYAKLTGPANVLIMPGLRSASIGVELIKTFANAETLGSILIGFEKSVQFINQIDSVEEIVNCACFSSFGSILRSKNVY